MNGVISQLTHLNATSLLPVSQLIPFHNNQKQHVNRPEW